MEGYRQPWGWPLLVTQHAQTSRLSKALKLKFDRRREVSSRTWAKGQVPIR